jgi:hypothetical protein
VTAHHTSAQARLLQRERARQRGEPVPPPPLLRVGVVYGPDLPPEELDAAVGADAMARGSESAYCTDNARVLRAQLVYQQPLGVQLRILLDLCSLRPVYVNVNKFLNALCGVPVGGIANRLCPLAWERRCSVVLVLHTRLCPKG